MLCSPPTKPQPPKMLVVRESPIIPIVCFLVIILISLINIYLAIAQIPEPFGTGLYPRPDMMILKNVEDQSGSKPANKGNIVKSEKNKPEESKKAVEEIKKSEENTRYWFYDADFNHDGQISLYEIIKFFELYDINNDGYITKNEVIKVEDKLDGSSHSLYETPKNPRRNSR